MNHENRQPIEDALQSYAEQRRRALGGPLAMPAHVRAQLHREIDRQPVAKAVSDRSGGTAWWRWLTHPWVWGGAAALMVAGLIAWQEFGPASVKYSVATRAPAEKRAAQPSNPPAATAPANATPALAPDAGGEPETQPVVTARPPKGSSELALETATAGRASERDLMFKAVPANPSPASFAPQAPAAGSTGRARVPKTDLSPTRYGLSATPSAQIEEPALRAGGATGGAASVASTPTARGVPFAPGLVGVAPVRQRAATAFREGATVPALQQRYVQAATAPATPVLNSFRIEKTGPQIRLVDADSSVYAATLEEPPSPRQEAAAPATASAAVSAAAPGLTAARPPPPAQSVSQSAGEENQNVQMFFLNAIGTNVRLQQQVVFNGNLLVTNLAGAPVIANQQALMTNEAALQFLLSNSRLEGQVLLGGTNQFPVLAVPTQR